MIVLIAVIAAALVYFLKFRKPGARPTNEVPMKSGKNFKSNPFYDDVM
jgi:hypothetical protein